MEKSKLILVDGSSYLFRAYYAHQGGFTTQQGKPTGAIHIMTRMLRKLMKEYEYDDIVVVMDAKGPTFRDELYSEYKANRSSMPNDLSEQIPYVHEIIKGLNLPLIIESGVEADDVIATYALMAEKEGREVIVSTGDKDLAQIVTANISLLDTMHDKFLDVEGVKAKFGVPPEQIADFLALKGDTADNIPGLPGCGDVKTVSLLKAYKNVEDLLARYKNMKAEVPGMRGVDKLIASIDDNIDQIKLSKALTVIKTDVAVPLALSDFKRKDVNHERLLEIYKELEFNRFIEEESKFLAEQQATNATTTIEEPRFVAAHVKSYITTIAELNKIKDEHQDKSIIAYKFIVDNSSNIIDSKVQGLAIAFDSHEAYFIPFSAQEDLFSQSSFLSKEVVLKELASFLSSDQYFKVGYNIKEDLMLKELLPASAIAYDFDVMLASHLIDNTVGKDLSNIAMHFLGESTQDLTKKSKDSLSIGDLAQYCHTLITQVYRLYQCLEPQLQADSKLYELFTKLEMPLSLVLAKMELRGARLSLDKIVKLNGELKHELEQIKQQIYELSGNNNFNIASPKQLGQVLFVEMGLTYPKKTKGDSSYSTAENILTAIIDSHPIIALILRYRTLAKLISSYSEKFPALISPRTQRIHTTFHQTGTVTGRLSSSDPNLQNIPAHSQEGKLLRSCFVAAEGYSMVAIDYSQIELRLMAHFSGDENLIEAFKEGRDIHASTAASILGKKIEEVTAEERSHAKATNFGLIYGMGAHGLSEQTKMTIAKAKQYIDNFFKHYPKIEQYMNAIVEQGSQQGYVETLMGHKLRFADLMHKESRMFNMAKRAAINAPMQGSASEIIKQAMLNVDQYISSLEHKDEIYMILQVHDELIFEIKDECLEQHCDKLRSLMNDAVQLKVPLSTSLDCSKSWE